MKKLPIICLLALAPMLAAANIIPTLTTIGGTGPFTWTYDLQLSSDQDVHSGLAPSGNPVPHTNLLFGSFLTIYDFAGYVAGTCVGPSGWSCMTQNTGFTPDDVVPQDNPTIPNLTWVYTSGPLITGQPNGTDLGFFSAGSIYNQSLLVSYAARGVKNNGGSSGTIADNVGNTLGPRALQVPEPTSLVLAGLALGLLAWSRPAKRSR
jgi:hypothetical protein